MTGRASASASAASSSERTTACSQPLPRIEVRAAVAQRQPDQRDDQQQPERAREPSSVIDISHRDPPLPRPPLDADEHEREHDRVHPPRPAGARRPPRRRPRAGRAIDRDRFETSGSPTFTPTTPRDPPASTRYRPGAAGARRTRSPARMSGNGRAVRRPSRARCWPAVARARAAAGRRTPAAPATRARCRRAPGNAGRRRQIRVGRARTTRRRAARSARSHDRDERRAALGPGERRRVAAARSARARSIVDGQRIDAGEHRMRPGVDPARRRARRRRAIARARRRPAARCTAPGCAGASAGSHRSKIDDVARRRAGRPPASTNVGARCSGRAEAAPRAARVVADDGDASAARRLRATPRPRRRSPARRPARSMRARSRAPPSRRAARPGGRLRRRPCRRG